MSIGFFHFFRKQPLKIAQKPATIQVEKQPKGATAMNSFDDKEKELAQEKDAEKTEPRDKTWVDDMKQDLEDYIEEQGIYIRQ